MSRKRLLRNQILKMQLILVAVGLLFGNSVSEAGIVSSCTRILTQLALPFAIEYHNGKTIRPDTHENDSSSITLGERIGLGDRGGLYRIDRSSIVEGVPPTTVGLVAKIPHTIRLSNGSGPHPQAELEMKREIQTYDLLKSQWKNVESDSQFPKDPAWKTGKIPTAPILKSFQSKEGTILIKPEIKGDSLKKLYEENRGKLPEDMETSLKEIYAMIKAVSSRVKTPIQDSNGGWVEGRPFYTDINPANLVWVSNPAEMNLLGLKRPSFVFYEMTPLINRMPQYLPLPESKPSH
jgi:hypothetical protein